MNSFEFGRLSYNYSVVMKDSQTQTIHCYQRLHACIKLDS